jgi:hypothetical protein
MIRAGDFILGVLSVRISEEAFAAAERLVGEHRR